MASTNGIGLMFTGSMILATGRGMKTETRRMAYAAHGRPHAAVSAERGTTLWTREAIRVTRHGLEWEADGKEFWRADASEIHGARTVWWQSKGGGGDGDPHTIEAMYQPFWCSRFHMRLRAAKVEPLRRITSAECQDEGLISWAAPGMTHPRWGVPGADGKPAEAPGGIGWTLAEFQATPQAAYFKLWDSLHGPEHSHLSNPDVVAIQWDEVEAMYPAVSPASEVHRWGAWA